MNSGDHSNTVYANAIVDEVFQKLTQKLIPLKS